VGLRLLFFTTAKERIKVMGIYSVKLGIDRGATDTRRRLVLNVLANDRLSAAIAAERVGDGMVRDPQVEYTHALSVKAVRGPRPAGAAVAAVAA
jgi:hypothetical protein